MKSLRTLTLLSLTMLFAACSPSEKAAVTGRPYELFVVSTKPVYNSAVGDTLKAIFNQDVEWLNQPEPLFDLFNTPMSAMKNITQRHRNLLFVNVDPNLTKTSFTVERDKSALTQLTLTLNAQSIDSAAKALDRYRETMVTLLNNAERDRFAGRAMQYGTPGMEETILKKFGFKMAIPRGFRLRVDGDNFLWLSNEMPLASQGIVIYTFDLNEAADSTWLVSERNLAVGKIPGPVKESYMSTDETFYPETMKVDINGRDWYETRGFWNVKGDFLGGPFANFVTVYQGHVIAIDLYVQSPSPKYGKRNFMRQMEALPFTVTFPEPKQQATPNQTK